MSSNMSTVVIRPYKPGEENYVAEAHERIYREEFGWGEAFSSYAKQIVYDFARLPKPEHAEMWIAESDGESVGSIMLQETEEGVGQLRLFLLEPGYRGRGIGIRLWNRAMNQAREWGFRHLFLGTAEPAEEARSIYARAGFAITKTEPVFDWTLDGSLVFEERWELDLE